MSTAIPVVPSLELLESQLGEQREVIQSLFEAFKLLTEENARKDKRMDKVERENAQLKQLISLHLVDGLENVRVRVEKMDRFEGIDKEVGEMKNWIEDIKFAMVPSNQPVEMKGLRSPSPKRTGPPPLPFIADSPGIGIAAPLAGGPALEKINYSLETLLSGLDYVGRQRNADVKSINASLEKLDFRIKQLALQCEVGGIGGADRERVSLDLITTEVRQVKEELIPQLEHEWSQKWGSLEGRVDSLLAELRRAREELSAVSEKMVVRDSKMAQLNSMADSSKRLMDRTEQLSNQVNNRILKLESDTQIAFEEIKRVEESVAHIVAVESKLDLSKSECKSNWERVVRVTKQDIDGLRIKIERLAIVKEEYERLSTEMRSLHDLVVGISTKRAPDTFVRMSPASPVGNGPVSMSPPLGNPNASPSLGTSDSSLSLMDEGLAVANGIVARLSAFPNILVPTGGAETGSLRVDSSTNRILWRIENVASMIREPGRYPKILVSPEFTATPVINGKEGETMVARMKLFPTGSDQSRVDGNCSFYLRCLPGVVVRYSVDIAGEVMDTFECSYEKQRDKGKHDFVKLNEYLQPDGAVILGLEVKSVAPMQN